MRTYLCLLLLCYSTLTIAQIGNPIHYPTLRPSHILDEKLDDISFAFSFRILESDYNGPLVRLRRASDNAEQDFFASDNDIVDVVSINTWRSGSNVYVVKWYDQSGLGRDAVQNSTHRQPRFYPTPTVPYFKGDGYNDILLVSNSNLQTVTNNGKEGTVFTLAISTNKSQFSFGAAGGGNRWTGHLNWSNGYAYFDAGSTCCNNPRNFANPINVWAYFTFIRGTNTVIANRNGVEQFNGPNTRGACTQTNSFGISNATGSSIHATTAFAEFIMYKKHVMDPDMSEIEQNAMTFWDY